MAFSRFFLGAGALTTKDRKPNVADDGYDTILSETRVFTRLTALASWRSEYILRTRLLRSLARGKPAELELPSGHGSSRSSLGHNVNAQVTYSSKLITTVNHLHATFRAGTDKRTPRFIHGADDSGSACLSEPRNSRVDQWGFADPQSFSHFIDRFPGDALYGLEAGTIVGVPNPMDVSQPHGLVYAEGFPGGDVYFRSVGEKRGRTLRSLHDSSNPELGIPKVVELETVCSVWIAKTSNIPDISEGLVGLLIGSSHGIVSSYSLGTDSMQERRLERGEVTARWVLSPGVPIIAIAADDNFSSSRYEARRIWAVVLNALGEIYYLDNLPDRPNINRAAWLDERRLEQLAWETGRSVYWTHLNITKRMAKPDPFHELDIDVTYSPRASWDGMGLSKAQIAAETKEIEDYITKKPVYFRQICDGWDMQRRLEVDFSSSDENGAGEGVIVIDCGLNEGQTAAVKRYTRYKLLDSLGHASTSPDFPLSSKTREDFQPGSSLFYHVALDAEHQTWSFGDIESPRRSSIVDSETARTSIFEDWRISTLQLAGSKSAQITTTALDMSAFAVLTILEDPLLSMIGSSATSSPISSPLQHTPFPKSPSGIPGQRGRFLAIGTKTGSIIIWNIRAPILINNSLDGTIIPVRIIHTDSPQISCLALSALYIVHGGNDGLVQAWDPLASTSDPIRTLNSRFSSRARRRLVQAEDSQGGVGINLFAAGAVCLDPDPTVLRGMVSLGSHLRYWSYSSSAAEQYKGNKRRPRRSERGSNQGADHFSGTGRGALKDYIANEKLELEQEKKTKRKEKQRLAGRFGLDLLGPGASEDEILAYATLLSEEAAENDAQKRRSASSGVSHDSHGGETMAEEAVPLVIADADDNDADIAEAIRLSLQEGHQTDSPAARGFGVTTSFPIRYAKRTRKSPSASPPWRGAFFSALDPESDDLEIALRLSLAEGEERE